MKNILNTLVTIVATIISTLLAQIAISKYSAGNLEYQVKSANYESIEKNNGYARKQCMTLINLSIENNSNFNEKNIQVKIPNIYENLLNNIEINSDIKDIEFNKTKANFIQIPELRQKEKARIQIKYTENSCISLDNQYLQDIFYISSDNTLAERKQNLFEKYHEFVFMTSFLGILSIIFLFFILIIDFLTPKDKKIANLEKQIQQLKDKKN